jgi:hypothetical protein
VERASETLVLASAKIKHRSLRHSSSPVGRTSPVPWKEFSFADLETEVDSCGLRLTEGEKR